MVDGAGPSIDPVEQAVNQFKVLLFVFFQIKNN